MSGIEFDRRWRTMRAILTLLKGGDKKFTPLRQASMRTNDEITVALFDKARSILLEKGYIERPSRGLYRLTDNGRKFLDTLNNRDP
jgi:hypothetical protein